MANWFTKLLGNGLGYTEETTVSTASAPAANQAGRVPELNGAGFVDITLLNAGATGGAPDASKVAQLDAGGKITQAMLPTGVGQDTNVGTATEALAGGDLVNWHSGGVRKADGSNGRRADGFVLVAVANGQPATVYAEGTCTGLTGLTAGPVWLSPTVPGGVTNTPPVQGSGKGHQPVGYAVSSSAINFQAGTFTQR